MENKLHGNLTSGIKKFIATERARLKDRLRSKRTLLVLVASLLYAWVMFYGPENLREKAPFVFVIFMIFMMANNLRKTERANLLISAQKKEIEEKSKEILDSITYAKRLQDAILPPLASIKQYLPESFVFYKPKDIVAGDFYWMEKSEDIIYIAAADCTGHGVPGAMVSVVCSNALNRTVKEFKITESGKILDKVRELVLETFEKSSDNIQDGMDISLCALSYSSPSGEDTTVSIIAPSSDKVSTDTSLPLGRERVRAQWSGAYNSLWYFQNKEIKELTADKQPIGKADKAIPFNTHTLNLQKGDILYLFTDGYADQFGGPKGKKFKYKQLQQLIIDNAQLTMEKQKNVLESKLNEWKGSLEQVDDILIIGIRV